MWTNQSPRLSNNPHMESLDDKIPQLEPQRWYRTSKITKNVIVKMLQTMERLSIAMKTDNFSVYSADLQIPSLTGLADLCWSVLRVESHHPVGHTVEWGLNTHISVLNYKSPSHGTEWRILTVLWCVSERSTSLWRKTGSPTAQQSKSCATIGLLWLISTCEAARCSAGPAWSTSVSNVWCVYPCYIQICGDSSIALPSGNISKTLFNQNCKHLYNQEFFIFFLSDTDCFTK